ncbi:hypothetical protein [Colwellia piezophila]|uniref:hypothetical protein n=1 Tax=Colwellia piezophila TaxID=211668 RepID=UPI00037F06F5|nr:hypothetical protein [Colwellia piezophila]
MKEFIVITLIALALINIVSAKIFSQVNVIATNQTMEVLKGKKFGDSTTLRSVVSAFDNSRLQILYTWDVKMIISDFDTEEVRAELLSIGMCKDVLADTAWYWNVDVVELVFVSYFSDTKSNSFTLKCK